MIPSKKETSRFERGFKTWAENIAVSVRSRLGLEATAPLCHKALAKNVGVEIWELSEIGELPKFSLDYLGSKEGDDWSALTVTAQKTVIVLNPSHSANRHSSSGMHELAHILRGHKPSEVRITEGGLTFRSYDPLQEAEADWLSGCLLLPRVALEKCLKDQLTQQEACRKYVVSSDLFNYRIQVTGVKKQYQKPPIRKVA